ncbi:hypothetical protein DESUT3_36130 [Desulfuromonas versatilis]|uniref:Uncharacterized protein n=1 Tax=Desulfuromonas versatilis TaxID=2802975 RepID=A0ABN6E568_9BACT|nr:hypothetical protein [Desulfuromonas versatilis]BCR06544.1 hypothetical protein DESUT3_36130 [Desulfuromonas versatilis]
MVGARFQRPGRQDRAPTGRKESPHGQQRTLPLPRVSQGLAGLTINFHLTDQHQGIDPPPLQKPPRPDQPLIPLPGRESFGGFAGTDLLEAIAAYHQQRMDRLPAVDGEEEFTLYLAPVGKI